MSHDHPDRTSREPATVERVVALEERFAYQQRTIDALDQVVRAFSVRVEFLEAELQRLRDTVTAMGLTEMGPGDEPPPHY
jgi:SlyX protein